MTDLSPVRGAVPEDEDAILDLCVALHAENGMWSLNIDKVRAMVRAGINRVATVAMPIYPTLGVVGHVGTPEGAICFTLTQPWYSDDWILSEFFNYVHPKYRKSRHAEALLKFAVRCVGRMHTPLTIGILSNHRTEAKIRIYRRTLGEPCGAFFVYSPPAPEPATAAISGQAA